MPIPNDVENMIREFEKRDGDTAFTKIELKGRKLQNNCARESTNHLR